MERERRRAGGRVGTFCFFCRLKANAAVYYIKEEKSTMGAVKESNYVAVFRNKYSYTFPLSTPGMCSMIMSPQNMM